MSEITASRTGTLRRAWRRVMPLVVITLIYFGMFVYPVLRIRLLISPAIPGTAELLLIMVAPLLGRLAYEFRPGVITRWLSALSLTWLGVCFMAFGLVLGYEVLHWLVPLDDRTWGLLLAATVAAFTVAGFAGAQSLHVREIPVEAPAPLAGLRIVQISDVHVGSRSGRFLSRVVRRVNDTRPDYVLITGDLIDFENIRTREIAALAQLDAPAYFIIGNHERYVDLDAICDRLTRLGVHVIRDATVDLPGIQLVGIDDAEPKTQVSRILKSLKPAPDAFRILLYHRPDGADDAAGWGAHLMLCGHTHNGQIFPFNYVVRRVFPRIRGLYRIGDMQLYVSPGTGTWGPVLRLGSRSEISLITLCNGN